MTVAVISSSIPWPSETCSHSAARLPVHVDKVGAVYRGALSSQSKCTWNFNVHTFHINNTGGISIAIIKSSEFVHVTTAPSVCLSEEYELTLFCMYSISASSISCCKKKNKKNTVIPKTALKSSNEIEQLYLMAC